MKKLLVIFLIQIFLLPAVVFAVGGKEEEAAVEGRKIPMSKVSINQAPEFRELVANGELPTLKDRLPEEPRVVQPVEGLIGKYGGTLRIGSFSNIYGIISPVHNPVALTKQSQDLSEVQADAVRDWDISDGGRIITFYMRKGMKWSDGKPFTSADIQFWYEDVLTNETLTPNINSKYYRAGELMKLEVVDKYTFKFIFAEPYSAIIEYLGTWGGLREWQIYYPKHYLEQFHPNYTDKEKLESAMKKEGFESWNDYFEHKAIRYNPEKPALNAYLPMDWDNVQLQRWRRNPYHFRVDPEGNQLPYIDNMTLFMNPDTQGVLLKVLAGELDSTGIGYTGGSVNYDLLEEGQEKGGYRIVQGSWMNNCGTVKFNYYTDDEFLNKLFMDMNFRIALSVALDREEINDLIYNGTYKIAYMLPGAPFGKLGGDMWKKHVEYDPSKANRLLDEIGLTKRDREGYRLRPDGSKLLFVLDIYALDEDRVAAGEMLKKYWGKVGLKFTLHNEDRTLWLTRDNAGKHTITTAGNHYGGGPVPPPLDLYVWQAPQVKWVEWMDTGGKSGIEPPQDVKRLKELQDLAFGATDREKYIEYIMEAYKIHVDNFWEISILIQSQHTQYRCISKKLKNIPPIFLDADVVSHEPYAWFFED